MKNKITKADIVEQIYKKKIYRKDYNCRNHRRSFQYNQNKPY